jgi:GTP-binding protein
MIEGYLLHRENLRFIFLLVDSRHEPQKIDLDFMAWLFRNKLPFALIFTKTDKLSKLETSTKPALYSKKVYTALRFSPEIILTSCSTRTGREEILDFIGQSMDRE